MPFCDHPGVVKEGPPPLIAAVLVGVALALAGLLAGGAGAASRDLTLGAARCELTPAARTGSAEDGGACEGVRPGGLVETRAGGEGGESSFCTLNFLFHGSDGRRYIGTAGHCVLGESAFDVDAGEKRWRRRGPVARDASGKPIGRYAYAILREPKDFALIRLRKRVEASPAMCHFGGPTGINADRPQGAVTLHFYGNGAIAGETTPARTLHAQGMRDPDRVHAFGPATPGDSGAGVISADGRAVGPLVSVGVHVGAGAGSVGITRLPPQLERARETLGLRLRLRKAPFGGS
jgi:hypothetical protein